MEVAQMKRLLIFLTGVCCAIILGTHAWALQPAEGSACQSNGDCPDGQVCEMTDCPAIACDPDDPDCEPVDCPEEGVCVDAGSNGWESTCETDADCPAGFACEVVGGMSEACAAGADCPEPETTEIYGCRPASCETDADCGGDLVCIEYETDCEDVTLSVPDCAGEDCPPEEENPPCEPATEGQCGPKWAAACEQAADCGEGFECVVELIDTCGGVPDTDVPSVPAPAPEPEDGEEEGSDEADEEGAGSEGGAGESKPFNPDDEEGDDEEDCEPEESDSKVCEPIEVACSTDADCTIEGWTCQDNGGVVKVAATCPEGEEDCEPETEEPVASEGVCLPSDWNSYGGDAPGISLDEKGTTDTNTGEGSQEPPTSPGDADAGGTTDDGGCNAGKSQGGLVLALFALFLAVLTRRREVSQS